MNFAPETPSLQRLVSVETVAALWNQPDILEQIASSFKGRRVYALREDAMEWKAIEEKVRSKVWALPLPQLVKEQLFHLVKPMGVEVICYCRYHSVRNTKFEVINISSIKQLRWTSRGTVDYAKTTERMVEDETVAVYKRYEMACIDCLEDRARSLLPLLSRDRRSWYLIGKYFIRREHGDLTTFFTCTLSEDERRLNRYFGTRSPGISIFKHLFDRLLPTGNRAGCEYFFERLNPGEKDRVFQECLPRIRTDFYKFSGAFGLLPYLSQMSEEELGHVFRKCISDLLACLLRCPMQFVLAGAAKRGWSSLTIGSCKEVLRAILRNFCDGFKDYDYARLFWECWDLCSAEYKHYFLGDIECFVLVIRTKEEAFFKLAFMEAPLCVYELVALLDLYGSEIMPEFYDEAARVLLDVRVISDAALMAYKDEAASNSSKNKRDKEKRLMSDRISQVVDMLLEKRRIRRSEIVF